MFHTILIGIDGGFGGRDAIALARRLAAPDARLTLVHVYASGIPVVPSVLTWDEVEEQRSDALLRQERTAAGIDADIASIGAMSAGEGLHRIAERLHADLLVVGSSSHGVIGRVLAGDDTRAALNGAPCAIAIAPMRYSADGGRFVRVGVGYDSGPESVLALEAARELAERDEAEVEALNAVHFPLVLPPPAGAWASIQPDVLDHARRVMAELPGVSGAAVLGDPRQQLVGLSRRVDLLVIGSRGYGPLRRMLLGSTATYLQRHVRCPLLIVPRGSRHRDDAVAPAEDGVHAAAGAEGTS